MLFALFNVATTKFKIIYVDVAHLIFLLDGLLCISVLYHLQNH